MLATQLDEVCQTLKSEDSEAFTSGMENLQKELVGSPLRKMMPNALYMGVNQVHEGASMGKVVSNIILEKSF